MRQILWLDLWQVLDPSTFVWNYDTINFFHVPFVKVSWGTGRVQDKTVAMYLAYDKEEYVDLDVDF